MVVVVPGDLSDAVRMVAVPAPCPAARRWAVDFLVTCFLAVVGTCGAAAEIAAAPASDTVTAKTARTNLTAGLRVMSVSLSAVSGNACSKPKQNLMGACAGAQLEL